MRDNHDGCPEIVSTYSREDHYFAAVRIAPSGESATFEFGVSVPGYHALKRILETRPFDSMPGIPYRYFFCGSHSGPKGPARDTFSFRVRVEQGSTAKNFDFEGPNTLLANLLWFRQLTSISQAPALRRLGQ